MAGQLRRGSMLFNALFNAYPVMLQRYNRLRLVPLIEQRARRVTLS